LNTWEALPVACQVPDDDDDRRIFLLGWQAQRGREKPLGQKGKARGAGRTDGKVDVSRGRYVRGGMPDRRLQHKEEVAVVKAGEDGDV